MAKGTYQLAYFSVGVLYFLINIFVRKLHTKNDPDDGWFLSLMWIFLWPMCFAGLFVTFLSNIKERIKAKV